MKIKNITFFFKMKDGGWILCECEKLKKGYEVGFRSDRCFKLYNHLNSFWYVYKNLTACAPTTMKSLIEMDKELSEKLGYPEIHQKFKQRTENRAEWDEIFNK